MPDILIDLDDVLVSFRAGAARAHGWDIAEVESRGLKYNSWQMADWFGMSEDEFWAPINSMDASFWYNLPTNSWAKELLDFVKDTGCEWYICTSPSLHKGGYVSSVVGKITWLETFLGPDLHRAFINPNKHKLCHPGDILIDDSPRNIEKFEARGGNGILFPILGNSNAEMRHDPLPYVKETLRCYT